MKSSDFNRLFVNMDHYFNTTLAIFFISTRNELGHSLYNKLTHMRSDSIGFNFLELEDISKGAYNESI